jgi:ribosome-associated translation inhibitor RaiA
MAGGFHETERDWIVRRMAQLDTHLKSFDPAQIDLEISLKDRDTAGQRVTLSCWIRRATQSHLVATSESPDLATALNEVRTNLVRQIEDAKTRTEPRSNRALRQPLSSGEPDSRH